MTAVEGLLRSPLFFEPNRVTRTYRGGRLLSRFLSRGEEEDGFRPEEWLASFTRARREGGESDEGLSRIACGGPLLTELDPDLRRSLLGGRPEPGILVKLIDSFDRLSVQVHPDRAFARERFGSSAGKTEMWLLLDVRPGALLHVGLKEGVGRRELSEAIAGRVPMIDLLNEVPARPGEAWFIAGRTLHALGAGCLVLEAQEPSDLVFRLERQGGGRTLSDFEMFGGLDAAAALDCVDFTMPRGQAAVAACAMKEAGLDAGAGVEAVEFEPKRGKTGFRMRRYRLAPHARLPAGPGPAIWLPLSGSGSCSWEDGSCHLDRTLPFLAPAPARLQIEAAESGMELIECLPPEAA